MFSLCFERKIKLFNGVLHVFIQQRLPLGNLFEKSIRLYEIKSVKKNHIFGKK